MPDTPPHATVIVLNWGRADLLPQTLSGLREQDADPFEVVVVSDRPKPQDSTDIKWVQVNEPNISVARNTGMAEASGDIFAFIDDDAVPERGWLKALMDTFHTQPQTAATGGPVIGPGGWRLQWGRMDIDPFGLETAAGGGICPKLSGTNFAITRRAIETVSGFDPRLRYFNDDTDMILRLCKAGCDIVWSENAMVHHGYAPSARRGRFGVPKSLYDIGRSSAIVLQTHRAGDDPAPILKRIRARERRRLLRLHLLGVLEGSEIKNRLAEFDAGTQDVLPAFIADPILKTGNPGPVFETRAARMRVVIIPTILTRRRARNDAKRLREQGCDVSIIEMRYSPRRLRVWRAQEGHWEHLGGTLRQGPDATRLPIRVGAAALDEAIRVHEQRSFTHVVGYDLSCKPRWWRVSDRHSFQGLTKKPTISPPFRL